MTQITNLVNLFAAQPWAIEASTFSALVNVFARKYRGETFSAQQIHAELGAATTRSRGVERQPPRIAVVPIQGVISQRPQSLGTSVDEASAKFSAAMNNASVDGILLAIDSPGGTVTGIPEFAGRIRDASAVKPVLAFTDGLLASAAYWLGAAAGEIIASPSAETGSIGVYMLHEDWSKNLEDEGIKITAFSAGKYKLEGAPWAPPSEEMATVTQARVDEVYGWFVKDVAQSRGASQQAVRDGYGEGRILGAKQSLEANLIDAVGTFDEAVARLAHRVELKQKAHSRMNATAVDATVRARTRARGA